MCVGANPIGALNEDLRAACLAALNVSRDACRDFAMGYSWENSARQFIEHMHKVANQDSPRVRRKIAGSAVAQGSSAAELPKRRKRCRSGKLQRACRIGFPAVA